MSKLLPVKTLQMIQTLAIIIEYSNNSLDNIRSGDDYEAAQSISLLIQVIENPRFLENLKEILDELRKPL